MCTFFGIVTFIFVLSIIRRKIQKSLKIEGEFSCGILNNTGHLIIRLPFTVLSRKNKTNKIHKIK
jgi:hypothetical protein